MPIVSSITSTSATVSWTPYGGASHTIVYYQVQGAGSWSSVNVAGSSYNLTGLLPCHTYEVKLRSLCGSVFVSDYTDIETFNTASSNPSVSITSTLVLNGCDRILSASGNFVYHNWTHLETESNISTSDTNNVITTRSGIYALEVVDINGCSATTTCTVPDFDSRCITRARELELIDSLDANRTSLRSDIVLLAKAFATVSNHSVIKQVVKNIALHISNPKPYYASIKIIQDSCTNRGINLKSALKDSLWNHGFSAPDTARFAKIIDSLKVATSPNSYIYPEIFYSMLDPEIIENAPLGWDGVSPYYVTASALYDTTGYLAYKIEDSEISQTLLTGYSWALSFPIWQIALTSKIPNAFEWEIDIISLPAAQCRCYDGPYSGAQDYDCSISGNTNKCGRAKPNCHGTCNSTLDKIIRWLFH